MELLEVLLKFENWYKWNTLKIVTEYTKKKKKQEENSCFTKLEIGEKNSSHWMRIWRRLITNFKERDIDRDRARGIE